jgi:hypothetical protein
VLENLQEWPRTKPREVLRSANRNARGSHESRNRNSGDEQEVSDARFLWVFTRTPSFAAPWIEKESSASGSARNRDAPRVRQQMKNVVTSNSQDRIPQLVNTGRAAEILGRAPATLKRWRYEGIGPDYVEMEGRVSYDVAVLLEYIRQNTRVPSVRAAMEESRGDL